MRWNKVLLSAGVAAVLFGCGDGTQQEVGGAVQAPENTPPVIVPDPTFPTDVTFTEVGVHDPSVIRLDDGTFYIFGSHMAFASSTDLFNWTQLNPSAASNEEAAANTPLFNTYETQAAEGISWVGGHIGSWASDVIQLADGKYYFYYNHCALPSTGNCVSRSYLGVAVSDDIEGPYENLGLILTTGHEGAENPGINGEDYDGNVHPNAIDPDVFFDKEGRLWMVYGSYSGGIWIMELDPDTGMALPEQGYGTKLMGGFYSAIEGPFMLYSPETDYYYLFTSFGGFAAADGYNMRISRSRNPDGPFLDSQGQDMIGASGAWSAIEPYGNKIMGGFMYDVNPGESGSDNGYMAPGHNSAYYDESTGQYFNIFHTRFPNSGEIHNVRVHEMFMNQDDWLVVAPHRYVPIEGENIVDEADLFGTFKLINHGSDINREAALSGYITLEDYNEISGEYTGLWYYEADNIVRLYIDGLGDFRGVASWQYNENAQAFVPTFSAIDEEGVAIWGSKLLIDDDTVALTNTLDAMTFPEMTTFNLSLPAIGANGAEITWTSSHPDYLEVTGVPEQPNASYLGVVTRPNVGSGDAEVSITATATLNGVSQSRTYTIGIPARVAYNRVAHYSFEGELNDELSNYAAATQTGDRPDNTGTVSYAVGQNGQAVMLDGTNGVRLPDGIINSYDYTVSMWLNADALNTFTTAFFGDAGADGWMSLVPQSWDGNIMLWSNSALKGSNPWFDGITGVPMMLDTWTHVAFSVNKGVVKIYIDGVQTTETGGLPDMFTGKEAVFTLGVNPFDIPFIGMIDELKFYDTALTEGEIRNLDVTPLTDQELLASAADILDLGDLSAVVSNLPMSPSGPYASAIEWTSSNPAVVSTKGVVTRPANGENDALVTLTANISLNGSTTTKTFEATVRALGLPDPVVHYSFDNDDLTETSGMYDAGVVTGANLGAATEESAFSEGVVGRALDMSGNYGIQLPDNLIGDNTYAISVWFNANALTSYTPVFFGYENGDSWISMIPGGHQASPNAMVWSGTAWYDAFTDQQLETGTWYHMVMVNNQGAMTIYLNGQIAFEGAGFPDVFSPAPLTSFTLGANFWDAAFNGMIDEVYVFDDTLNQTDVTQIYESQRPE
ncbi:LamG-like jellyroll fold domain-containing protein [Glaciecola sp. 1036]|uniref:LamG-like jellyroll fold domain-containing protein n=1 Tax=Alteromonadaceae TaxID=72275 RepID=UPI003D02A6FB